MSFVSRSNTMQRPQTAQSILRPPTARPPTAMSSRPEGNNVLAIIEGRGVSREVGMALLNRDTGVVLLVQLADSQSYAKTMHQMHINYPALVLVPHTSLSDEDGGDAPSTPLLVKCIMDEFAGVPVEPVQRKYWSDMAGMDFVRQLAMEGEDSAGTLLAVANKYYALSAMSALFKYTETKLNTRYAAGSLRIRYVPVEGTMMIDMATAQNLELVSNATHKKSSHSLFGLMNYTHTAMGSRLLRVTILAPSTAQSAIDARLDVVEEFMQTEDRFTAVKTALQRLNKVDLDKLIYAVASSETRPTTGAKVAATRVSQMLSLRAAVKTLPAVQYALEGSRSALLRVVHTMISDERLGKIEGLLDASLNEDATPAKTGLAALNARVYAVRANYNRLLDVARETYKENVGDIFALCRDLCQQHGLSLQLVYQGGGGGFVFALKKAEVEEAGGLPKGFVNVTASKGRVVFSSLELQKRNARMKDALDETLLLSDKIIQDLIATIITDIGALYKASEALALLDMLWSFSHVSIMRQYGLRPEFTGTLAIKGGRHPILESVQGAESLVANDAYCSDSSYFQVIQGPNMSGKSTYLRQVGLLTIMAMCGCFVPAQYASFRVHDSLLTRLSNDDDIEKNLSTFANEMASCAMILGLATSKSLILIDELGRGTAPVEGIGISHAISEALIKIKCFVFFATHFNELTLTLSREPAVVHLHLAVRVRVNDLHDRRRGGDFPMIFQYRVMDGAFKDGGHYGIDLSQLADLPPDVVREGRRVAEHLSSLAKADQERSQSNRVAQRRKALLQLRTELKQALEVSTLPDEELLEYIARLQREVAASLSATISE